MGILDNVTSAVNRGTESAGRAAEKIRLKNQINEINKRRQQLAAQLGASLYDLTKEKEKFCKGRETLYDGIEACDAERAACQAKIDELEARSQAAAVFKCAVCGASINGDDLFCSGCGAPAERARPAYSMAAPQSGPKCAKCGAVMSENDMFCMTCGAKKQETSVVEQEHIEEIVTTGEPEHIEAVRYTDTTFIKGGQ